MVVPVADVEGPVVGTTWSSTHPARVGPGTVAATPGVRPRVVSAAACLDAGTRTWSVPGAPGPKPLTTSP